MLDRAWAKIRSMYSGEDSEGNLSEDCQKIYSNTDCRRLTITKKCEERKDGGVAARQSVPFAHIQYITRFRGDTGCQGLLNRDGVHEIICQSIEFCFESLCHLLCPSYQFYKEFPDHCNKNITFSVA